MGYINSNQQLQILVSKKGTKVVTAYDLHNILQLPRYKFNSNISKWLTDIYQFSDNLRQPVAFRDFSERKLQYSKGRDYYISIELAKMITLASDSKVKLEVAKVLMTFMDKNSSNRFKKSKAKKHLQGKFDENQSIDQKTTSVQLGLW